MVDFITMNYQRLIAVVATLVNDYTAFIGAMEYFPCRKLR